MQLFCLQKRQQSLDEQSSAIYRSSQCLLSLTTLIGPMVVFVAS
jgi:hypothetical protein